MKNIGLSSVGRMLFAGCLSIVALTSTVTGAPLYRNSVVSNNHEFIATSDESAFACLTFDGRREAEMADNRSDRLMVGDTFIFTARYTDGTTVGLRAHPKFKSRKTALKFVEPVAVAVGKLPTFMRATLNHVVIHRGDEIAFGESEGHFFVLYWPISGPASAITISRKPYSTNRFMRR